MIHWCDSDWSLTALLYALDYAHSHVDDYGARQVLDASGECVYIGGYDATLVWLADEGHIGEHPNIAHRRSRFAEAA